MELMLDGNQRLTEDQALDIARELDRLGFTWFEEPIPQADIDGYARLNAAVDMPITGGEQFTTLEQFRPYLEKRAYDIVQPDVGWCGITEAHADRRGGRPLRRGPVPAQLAQRPDGDGQRAPGGRAAQPARAGAVHDPGPAAVGDPGAAPAHRGRLAALPDKPGLGVALAKTWRSASLHRRQLLHQSRKEKNMSHEHFFVTGALGCIGAWVVRELVLEGVPVSIYDLGGSPHRLRLILDDEQLTRVHFSRRYPRSRRPGKRC